MNYAIKGVYTNGVVDLFEKPDISEPTEVLVIFWENKKKVKKIRGLFRDYEIDYEKIEEELRELSRDSVRHIMSEAGERE